MTSWLSAGPQAPRPTIWYALVCGQASARLGPEDSHLSTQWNPPSQAALVLAGAGNGHRDVPQVGGELRVIAPEVGVWGKDPWAKHDRLHTEADEQDVAEEPNLSLKSEAKRRMTSST